VSRHGGALGDVSVAYMATAEDGRIVAAGDLAWLSGMATDQSVVVPLPNDKVDSNIVRLRLVNAKGGAIISSIAGTTTIHVDAPPRDPSAGTDIDRSIELSSQKSHSIYRFIDRAKSLTLFCVCPGPLVSIFDHGLNTRHSSPLS
jgi:hypothetical protein